MAGLIASASWPWNARVAIKPIGRSRLKVQVPSEWLASSPVSAGLGFEEPKSKAPPGSLGALPGAPIRPLPTWPFSSTVTCPEVTYKS